MSDLNIYQRINNIMKEVNYIKRGSAGQGTGVLYDEVICLLRPSLIEHGVMIRASFTADSDRQTKSGSYIYQGCFNIRYQNIDDPKDHFTDQIVAHAMDSGDKAPGKAITYATKMSMLKVFSIETGIDDESRMAEQLAEKELLKALEPTAKAIIDAVVNDQPDVVLEAWRECSELEMQLLWKAKTKGGFFTKKEKDYIRSAQIADSTEE